jgi:AcrR family transcriptional regulator
MELLWGVPKVATRGPRPGLTVERVVEVAIAIADGEGLDAVSMRRVAEQLGVGTMSLYTYVPGKTELLELMHDTVLGEVAWTFDESTTWRQRLESLARADWDFALRHPWMLDIPWARAPLGPNAMAGYERAASAVIGCGLTGREVTNVIGLVSMFVRSAARLAVEAAAAQRRTGQTDTEWWEARAPLLEHRADRHRVVGGAGAAPREVLRSGPLPGAVEPGDGRRLRSGAPGLRLLRGRGARLLRVRAAAHPRRHRGAHRDARRRAARGLRGLATSAGATAAASAPRAA